MPDCCKLCASDGKTPPVGVGTLLRRLDFECLNVYKPLQARKLGNVKAVGLSLSLSQFLFIGKLVLARLHVLEGCYLVLEPVGAELIDAILFLLLLLRLILELDLLVEGNCSLLDAAQGLQS